MTTQTMSGPPIEKQYEMLRKTLANYLLLQVDTFVKGMGVEAIKPAMDILTEKKAELKVAEIKESGVKDQVQALSQHLVVSMDETFDSDFNVETGTSFRTVNLDRCGCIESVTEESGKYNLSREQVKSIFCGTCIGSYKKAAQMLDLEFKGRLSKQGCTMSFSNPKVER